MSLTYGGATTDDSTKASPTGLGLTSLGSFTALGWIFVTTLTGTRTILRIGGSSGAQVLIRLSGATGNVEFAQTGAVTMDYVTNDTPLATTSAWRFVAFASTIGTAGHIYTGTLTAVAAERAYGTATAGTGPPTAQTGTNELTLGNGGSAASVAIQGRLGGFWQVYDRQLTLGEIQSVQYTGRLLTSCKGYYRPGDTGTTTVTDYSGTGNHLTNTGATLSNNPPLPSPRRRVQQSSMRLIASVVKFRPYFTGP